MEWVETTGRTVEEALDVALDELGVDEQDVDYEVLVEPRGGLLGRLGSSEARIRARVKPLSREKPGDRPRRGRGRGGDGNVSSGASRGNGGERRRRGRPSRERKTTEDRGTVDDDFEEMSMDEQAKLAAEFAVGFVEAFGVEANVQGTVTEEERVRVDIDGPQVWLL